MCQRKPYQLHLAQQCGMTIPDTLITNDPVEVRRFFQEVCGGQMIYKALGRNVLQSPEGNRYLFTSVVQAQDLAQQERLDAIRTTAHLFQRRIPKRLEVRATIIGATIFAAELYSQQSKNGKVDFRLSYDDLVYARHSLPLQIQKQLLQLMRMLRLEYAAIDLILTPDDQYVFLEANCSGQFGWIEDRLHWPMSRTLVDVLMGEAPHVGDMPL